MAKIDIILLHYSVSGYIVTCKYCKKKRFYLKRSDFGNSICTDCGSLAFGCRSYTNHNLRPIYSIKTKKQPIDVEVRMYHNEVVDIWVV